MVSFWQKECINKECIILRKSAETVLKQIVRGKCREWLYQCFLGGRPDLCFGADINGKNEDDAGTHHGASGGHRCGHQCPCWYEPFQDYAGAGASVPLLGFGNVLMKGVKEAVQEQGFLGLFAGGFKAGAVGTSAALILGYLASLLSKPKMKE